LDFGFGFWAAVFARVAVDFEAPAFVAAAGPVAAPFGALDLEGEGALFVAAGVALAEAGLAGEGAAVTGVFAPDEDACAAAVLTVPAHRRAHRSASANEVLRLIARES
jgi:hypothetical protein